MLGIYKRSYPLSTAESRKKKLPFCFVSFWLVLSKHHFKQNVILSSASSQQMNDYHTWEHNQETIETSLLWRAPVNASSNLPSLINLDNSLVGSSVCQSVSHLPVWNIKHTHQNRKIKGNDKQTYHLLQAIVDLCYKGICSYFGISCNC